MALNYKKEKNGGKATEPYRVLMVGQGSGIRREEEDKVVVSLFAVLFFMVYIKVADRDMAQ